MPRVQSSGPPTGADEGQVATFLLADLAGYTALTEAHGDRRAAEVAGEFCAAVRGLAGEYGADEVKTIGDAILVRVEQAGEAMHLGARIVNDVGARHRSLGVRVGMHTGSAVRHGGDWYGAGVNVAARVAALAAAGDVLLTAETRDAAGDSVPDGQLRARGRQRLKNVGLPVELFALDTGNGSSAGPLPVDPVCRMAVDPAQSDHRSTHRRGTYHFCSSGCQAAFEAEPARYVAGAGRGGPGSLLLRALGPAWRRLRRRA